MTLPIVYKAPISVGDLSPDRSLLLRSMVDVEGVKLLDVDQPMWTIAGTTEVGVTTALRILCELLQLFDDGRLQAPVQGWH